MATLSSKTGLPSFTTGGGGGGGRNYVFSPSTYVPAATANDLGWFNSGGTPTTITTGLPRESDLSAIQFVSNSIGDYLRYRFKADDADISRRLQVLFAETATFGDFKLQVFSGTNAALASPLEIITQSLYTNSSGVMNLPTGTLDILANFDLTTRQYYEVRWTALAGAKTIKISGVNIGAGKSGSGSTDIPWQSFPPTVSDIPTSLNTGQWRKVGTNMELLSRQTASGIGTGGPIRLTIPFGLHVDTTKIAVGSVASVAGHGELFNGTNFLMANIYPINDTQFNFIIHNAANDLLGTGVASGNQIGWKISIPIAEWANTSSVAVVNPIANSPIRAGTIQAFAGATTPAGWLDCDGAQYSQNQYPQLFAQIGTAWATCTNPLTGSAYAAPSAGNFRVPDLRGVFLRGAGTFTDSIGTNTTLAGYQADSVQSHAHPNSAGFKQTGDAITITGAIGSDLRVVGSTSGANVGNMNNGDGRAATETRPRNVGVRYIIKAWDESFNLAGFAAATATNSGLVSSEFASPEGDLGTLTWSGTAPSGASNKKYIWYRVGKHITLEFRIAYGVAGVNNASVNFSLPAGIPTPLEFSTSTTNAWVGVGSGGLLVSSGAGLQPSANNGAVGLFKTASSTYEIYAYAGPTGIAATFAFGTISWVTT